MTNNPISDHSAIVGSEVAEAIVEDEGMKFRVVGTGDVALQMAACATGDTVEIRGLLAVHAWKTGDGREHQRWEIKAESLNRISRT